MGVILHFLASFQDFNGQKRTALLKSELQKIKDKRSNKSFFGI